MSKEIKSNEELGRALKRLINECSHNNFLNLDHLEAPGRKNPNWIKIKEYLGEASKRQWDQFSLQDICQLIALLKKGTSFQDKLSVHKQGENMFVAYSHCPNINKQSDLLKQIQKNKTGLYVDEDCMKNPEQVFRNAMYGLMDKRQVIPLRTKKAKNPSRNQKYEHYYLFCFEEELKRDNKFQKYFKKPLGVSLADQSEQERKFQIWYETKTSIFRKKYQEICSLNAEKGADLSRKPKGERKAVVIETAEDINFRAIPNLHEHIQRYLEKNRDAPK